MSEGKHTPTPWELGTHSRRAILKDAAGIADGCDAYVIAVASAHSLLSNEEAMANAAFIVRAVNSHNALVKAMELASQRFRELGYVDFANDAAPPVEAKSEDV